MCKGGGGTVSGTNYKLETIDSHINKGDILDEDHGFTMLSLHVNTMLGSITGTPVVLSVVTCLIVACSGPLRQLWRRMRLCYGTGENTERNGRGRTGGAGMEMQNFDRHCSDYQMSLMNLSNMQNMNPNNARFGPYVGMNIGGSDGSVRAPPSGKETGGGMTPM